MNLREIIEKSNKLKIYEQRCLSDEYYEAVIYSQDLGEWYKIFTAILGPAAKPEGTKASKQDQDLAKDYGGIFDNQTLFKKEEENAMVIAMFWPWQNKIYTTIKIAFLEKK
ncbi:MAG: hypothetical protein KBB01_03370 [Candidatus Omnitrophica bacterium]|jgi:hypothetical protein|nr:hypothetical protein [Candidatus Omnitrophota bacterium]